MIIKDIKDLLVTNFGTHAAWLAEIAPLTSEHDILVVLNRVRAESLDNAFQRQMLDVITEIRRGSPSTIPPVRKISITGAESMINLPLPHCLGAAPKIASLNLVIDAFNKNSPLDNALEMAQRVAENAQADVADRASALRHIDELRDLRLARKYRQMGVNSDYLADFLWNYFLESVEQYQLKVGGDVDGLSLATRKNIVQYRLNFYNQHVPEHRRIVDGGEKELSPNRHLGRMANSEQELQASMKETIDAINACINNDSNNKLAAYSVDDLQNTAAQYIYINKVASESYKQANRLSERGHGIAKALLSRVRIYLGVSTQSDLQLLHQQTIALHQGPMAHYLPTEHEGFTARLIDSKAAMEAIYPSPCNTIYVIKDSGEMWSCDRLGAKARLRVDCRQRLKEIDTFKPGKTTPELRDQALARSTFFEKTLVDPLLGDEIHFADKQKQAMFDQYIESSGAHKLTAENIDLATLRREQTAPTDSAIDDFTISNQSAIYQKTIRDLKAEGIVLPNNDFGTSVYFILHYGSDGDRAELFSALQRVHNEKLTAFSLQFIEGKDICLPSTVAVAPITAFLEGLSAGSEADKKAYETFGQLSSLLLRLNFLMSNLDSTISQKNNMQEAQELALLYESIEPYLTANHLTSLTTEIETLIRQCPVALSKTILASHHPKAVEQPISRYLDYARALLLPDNGLTFSQSFPNMAIPHKKVLIDNMKNIIDQLFSEQPFVQAIDSQSLTRFIDALKKEELWSQGVEHYFLEKCLAKMDAAIGYLQQNDLSKSDEQPFLDTYFSKAISTLFAASTLRKAPETLKNYEDKKNKLTELYLKKLGARTGLTVLKSEASYLKILNGRDTHSVPENVVEKTLATIVAHRFMAYFKRNDLYLMANVPTSLLTTPEAKLILTPTGLYQLDEDRYCQILDAQRLLQLGFADVLKEAKTHASAHKASIAPARLMLLDREAVNAYRGRGDVVWMPALPQELLADSTLVLTPAGLHQRVEDHYVLRISGLPATAPAVDSEIKQQLIMLQHKLANEGEIRSIREDLRETQLDNLASEVAQVAKKAGEITARPLLTVNDDGRLFLKTSTLTSDLSAFNDELDRYLTSLAGNTSSKQKTKNAAWLKNLTAEVVTVVTENMATSVFSGNDFNFGWAYLELFFKKIEAVEPKALSDLHGDLARKLVELSHYRLQFSQQLLVHPLNAEHWFIVAKNDGHLHLAFNEFFEPRIMGFIARHGSPEAKEQYRQVRAAIAQQFIDTAFSEDVTVTMADLQIMSQHLYGSDDYRLLLERQMLTLFGQYDQSVTGADKVSETLEKIFSFLPKLGQDAEKNRQIEKLLSKLKTHFVNIVSATTDHQDKDRWVTASEGILQELSANNVVNKAFVAEWRKVCDFRASTMARRSRIDAYFTGFNGHEGIDGCASIPENGFWRDVLKMPVTFEQEAYALFGGHGHPQALYPVDATPALHEINQTIIGKILNWIAIRDQNAQSYLQLPLTGDPLVAFYDPKMAKFITTYGSKADKDAYDQHCLSIAGKILAANARRLPTDKDWLDAPKFLEFSPAIKTAWENSTADVFSPFHLPNEGQIHNRQRNDSGSTVSSQGTMTGSLFGQEQVGDELDFAAVEIPADIDADALEALRHKRESTKKALVADITRFEQALTAYKATLSNDWWIFSTKKTVRTQSVDELLTKIHRVQASFKKPDFVDSFELLKDFFSSVETTRAAIDQKSNSRLLKVLNESNCDLVLSAEQLDVKNQAFNNALFSYHVVQPSEPAAAASIFFVDRVQNKSTPVPLLSGAKLPSFIQALSNPAHKKNLSLKELDKIQQRTGHAISQGTSRNFTKKSAAAWYRSEMSGHDIHTRVFDAGALHAKFGGDFAAADPLQIDPVPSTDAQQALKASQSQLITTLSASKTALQTYLQKKGRSSERAAVVADLVGKIEELVKQLQYPQEIATFQALVTQLNALVTKVDKVKDDINRDLDNNYTFYRGKSDLLTALGQTPFTDCQKHALEWTTSRFKQPDGLLSLNARCATREALEAELHELVPTMTPEKINDLWDQVEPLKTKVVQEALLANNFEWQASDANLPIELRLKALHLAIFSLVPPPAPSTAVPAAVETRVRAHSEDLRALIAKLNQADAAFNAIKQSPESLKLPRYAHLAGPQEVVTKSLHAVAMHFHCSDYLAEVLLEEQWQLPANAESLPADIKLAALAKALPQQLAEIATLMDQPERIYTAWATATDLFDASKDADLPDSMVGSVATQLLALKTHWLTSYLITSDFTWPRVRIDDITEEDQLQCLRAAINIQFAAMPAETTALAKITVFRNAYEACAAELPGIDALKGEIATKGQAWFIDACCEHDFSDDVLDSVTDKALLLPWLEAAIAQKSAQLVGQNVGVRYLYTIVSRLNGLLVREGGSLENTPILATIQAKLDELGAAWITRYLAIEHNEALPVESAVFSDKAYWQGIINGSGQIPPLVTDQETADFYRQRTPFLLVSLAKRGDFQAIDTDSYAALNVEPLKNYLDRYLAASCDLIAKGQPFSVDVRMVELGFKLKYPFSIEQLLMLLTPGKLSAIDFDQTVRSAEERELAGRRLDAYQFAISKQLLAELLHQLSHETCSDQVFQDGMECLRGWPIHNLLSEAGNTSLHKIIDRQLSALDQNMQQGSFDFLRDLAVTRGLGTAEQRVHPLLEKYATVEKDLKCVETLKQAPDLRDHHEVVEAFNQRSLHERYTLRFSQLLDELKMQPGWATLKPFVQSLQALFLVKAWPKVVTTLLDMGLHDSAGRLLRDTLLPMAKLLSLLPPAVIVNKSLAERLSTGTFKSSTSGLTDGERNSSLTFSQAASQLSQLTSLPSNFSMSGKESLDSDAHTDRLTLSQPKLAPSRLTSLPVVTSDDSFDSNATTNSGYSSGEEASPIANSSQSSSAGAELYTDRKTFILALMQEAFNRESPVPQRKRLLMLKEALIILRGLSIDGAKESITEDTGFQYKLVEIFTEEENYERLSVLNLEPTLSERIVKILTAFQSQEDTVAFAENSIEDPDEIEASAKLGSPEKHPLLAIVIEQLSLEQQAVTAPINTKATNDAKDTKNTKVAELRQFLSRAINTSTLLPLTTVKAVVKHGDVKEEFQKIYKANLLRLPHCFATAKGLAYVTDVNKITGYTVTGDKLSALISQRAAIANNDSLTSEQQAREKDHLLRVAVRNSRPFLTPLSLTASDLAIFSAEDKLTLINAIDKAYQQADFPETNQVFIQLKRAIHDPAKLEALDVTIKEYNLLLLVEMCERSFAPLIAYFAKKETKFSLPDHMARLPAASADESLTAGLSEAQTACIATLMQENQTGQLKPKAKDRLFKDSNNVDKLPCAYQLRCLLENLKAGVLEPTDLPALVQGLTLPEDVKSTDFRDRLACAMTGISASCAKHAHNLKVVDQTQEQRHGRESMYRPSVAPVGANGSFYHAHGRMGYAGSEYGSVASFNSDSSKLGKKSQV